MRVTPSPPCWGVEGDYLFKVLVNLSHWRLQTTLLNIPGHIGRCDLALRGNGLETTVSQECMTPVGLEPTIPGS